MSELQPAMYIVAGAPGSGKSTLLPLVAFGVDFFNADDESARRNEGSYLAIRQDLRTAVNRDFAAFVEDHIAQQRSFALETTLRTEITLQQAQRARQNGLHVAMFYIATESVEINLQRILARAKGGGHSAPETILRAIHARSYETLATAIQRVGSALDRLTVLDNSVSKSGLTLGFELKLSEESLLTLRAGNIPPYLQTFYEQALARRS